MDFPAASAPSTLLIVDDDEKILAILTNLLKEEGYTILAAKTGKQALELAQKHTPHLALIDVVMPGVDGLTLCQAFSAESRPWRIPVVLMTSLTSRADVAKGMAAGAIDYIKKPFDGDEVRFRVRTHLRLQEMIFTHQRTHHLLSIIDDAAKDAIIMIEGTGRIAHWNRAAEKIFGYASGEAMGQNLHELLAPERFMAAHRAAFPHFAASGKGAVIGKTIVLAARRKGGEEFPIELSLSATEVFGQWWAIGIVRDLTDRQRMEQDLRESEERHRLLFESSRDAMMTLASPGWNFTSCNQAAVKLFRLFTKDQFLSQGPQELSPARQPDGRSSAEAARCMIETALEQGFHFFEWEHLKADGEPFTAEVLLTRMERAGEMFLHATVRDITERKRVEKRLCESESRLRGILDSIPVGLAVIALDKRIRWVNHAMVTLTQRKTPEQLVGQSRDLLCAGLEDSSLMFGQGTTIEPREKLLARADGSTISVLKTAHLVEFSGETVLLEVFIDLSSYKHLETELAHARKLEAVGQLASGIAHEINTPAQFVGDSLYFLKKALVDVLALIGKYRQPRESPGAAAGQAESAAAIEEFERTIDLDFLLSEIPEALGSCIDGVHRIAHIVKAMKEFAHPDQREQASADINRALESTIIISRNEYKLVADIETHFGDLPPVTCYIGQLNQVFLNLLVNAAQAIGEVIGSTGKKGLIQVTTRCEEEWVIIEIADNGPGIPEAIRLRLFEPFFTTKPIGKGTGQGLAIARSIIHEKHGGTLTFKSTPGKPTVFSIRLPIEGLRRS